MRNKNFVRKKQAIYISPNKKSTRIIKTLMDFSFFIKIKIKMVCFSVPSPNPLGFLRHSTDWKVFPTIGSLLSIQTYRYRVRCYNWLVHQIFFQLMLQIDPPPGDSAGPTHKTFHFSIQTLHRRDILRRCF